MYTLLNDAIVKATSDDIRISVAVLLAAISLSTPSFSHTGIRINAPPIARVAPTSPAKNPAIMKYRTLSWLTIYLGTFLLFLSIRVV